MSDNRSDEIKELEKKLKRAQIKKKLQQESARRKAEEAARKNAEQARASRRAAELTIRQTAELKKLHNEEKLRLEEAKQKVSEAQIRRRYSEEKQIRDQKDHEKAEAEHAKYRADAAKAEEERQRQVRINQLRREIAEVKKKKANAEAHEKSKAEEDAAKKRIEKNLELEKARKDAEERRKKAEELKKYPVKKKGTVYIIAGPTAVGKSAVALMLAKKIDGEIVNCDSVQVYKDMDIGSAKPSEKAMAKVPHHLYGIIDPHEQMNAAEYQKLSLKTIDDILARGKTPIVCGGTGLYLNSIIFDMTFAAKPKNEKRRKELEEMAEKNGSQYMYEYLTAVDPKAAARIHPNNLRKVIRAIESWELGSSIKSMDDMKPNPNYDFKIFGLTMDRQWLYDRINRRVIKLVKAGLIDEVKGLAAKGLDENSSSMKAIGYREIFQYLNGELTLKEAVLDIMKNTRHYAKRQITWLRRYRNIHWIEIKKGDRVSDIVSQILEISREMDD